MMSWLWAEARLDIDKVKEALKDFRSLASANGVAPLFIDMIESRLEEIMERYFNS